MNKKWWHGKIAYQIYPKSFYDANGDGVGDLRGIISKLDYLKGLGIDIIWISPIYESPFVDQGYDISDYYKIASVFGTMDEFDELLEEAQKRDIKIVMDLVINHCSDKHKWFQEALKDPYGEYGQYFYFREGKNGHAPSNGRSYFGGSIWEPVPGYENLYYLHMFAKEQPDLNWHNPKVLKELYTMINWWLEKGVAGFRIDAIINIQKDLSFPDFEADGPDGMAACTKTVESGNDINILLKDLKENTFDQYQAFTVGEVFNMDASQLEAFVGENGHFSSMFDFGPHLLTQGEHGWYDSPKLDFFAWRNCVKESQQKLETVGFLSNIIENHDEPRGVNVYLPEYAQNDAGIKMLAATSVLLRGLPFIYQGQEIGMRNLPVSSVNDYEDINTIDQYNLAIQAGCSEEEALAACFQCSRDNARTPMQWSADAQAGFTTGTPWFQVNPNYTQINEASQQKNPHSVLQFYRRLIKLRKEPAYVDTFTYGSYEPAFEDATALSVRKTTAEQSSMPEQKNQLEQRAKIFAYYRRSDTQKLLILSNFDEKPVQIDFDGEFYNVLLTNEVQIYTDYGACIVAKSGTAVNGSIVLPSCACMVLERA